MLSRVADSIYWMSRYVERAENLARFVDINLSMMLEAGGEQQWWPLVNTTGDHEFFKQRFGEANLENVTDFLTFDRSYPNSIISCVTAARENARSVREIISSEMWLQLNKFYLMVNDAASRKDDIESLNDFFSQVKLASHLFNGITDATMTHGEAWRFCDVARVLERADKTSRLVDVKYFILLRSVADVGTPMDDSQWAAVLRSASAFEMYRKCHGRVSPKGIVQFLLLDPDFPRSVHFCLTSAQLSLHAISSTPVGSFRNTAEKCIGQLCSDLNYAVVEEILTTGLHEYLDDLQTRLNQLGNSIHQTFFAKRMPEPGKQLMSQRMQ